MKIAKVLLQNRKTELFFRAPSQWAATFGAAKKFTTTQDALFYARKHDLQDVQIVVALILPLRRLKQ